MNNHKKTKAKIRKLLNIADTYLENQKINSDTQDLLFLVSAFEEIINTTKNKLLKSSYTHSEFHDDIYEFDSSISAWRQHLPYRISSEQNSNDLYDVLFSVLQGLDDIISEDYLYWEEEKDLDINK